MDGCIIPGNGLDVAAMSLTIDLENIEVVELQDVITDMERLCSLLLEDQFENISIWEDTLSTAAISQEYSGLNVKKELMDALLGTHKYRDIEWYTDGNKLVVVTADYYYEEYAADIDLYPGLVDKNFHEKLQKAAVQ